MNKTHLLFLLFTLLFIVLLQNSYSQERDYGSLLNYRLPETSYHNFKVIGDLDFSSNATSGNSKSKNMIIGLVPEYSYLSNSDGHEYFLKLKVDSRLSTYKSESDNNENTSDQYETNFSVNAHVDDYMSNSNWCWSIVGEATVSLDENKQKYTLSNSYRYNSQKNQWYVAGFGIGWGKIRDVTPVISALQIKERIGALGYNNEFSIDQISKLAGVISQYDEYAAIYERPDKYFWSDFEESLSGFGREYDFTNYEHYYISDVLKQIKYVRKEGFKGGLNLMFDYNKWWNKSENTSASNYNSSWMEILYAQFRLFAEYSHQLNLNSQIKLYADLRGGPQLIEKQNTKQEYSAYLNIDYLNEFRDNLLWRVSNSTRISQTNANGKKKYFNNRVESEVRFYIEDNISLSFLYNWVYLENNPPYGILEYSKNNHSIQVGITYFINKGLEI